MNNFIEFESRSFDLNLLNEMYAIPSKELPTSRITEILTIVTGQNLDNIMVSTIFSNAGLNLRERTRVAPKAVTEKVKRVTKAEKVNNLLGLLGITPAVNGETNEETTTEGNDEELTETEQENQYVDEAVENAQLGRNTESIYDDGGIAREAAYNHVSA